MKASKKSSAQPRKEGPAESCAGSTAPAPSSPSEPRPSIDVTPPMAQEGPAGNDFQWTRILLFLAFALPLIVGAILYEACG